ncbi:MAG: methyltransferase domain-containing protein [Candidatus Lokiarchaeota archaeon]|nr:methyltransferase domain-containing protein [Candidatus Lokiarchaeota archaeon]
MNNKKGNKELETQEAAEKNILDSLSIGSDVLKWYSKMGEEFFRRIGLQPRNVVLDFGCRVGHYTIPAARVVGSKGTVYALDKKHSAIDELMYRASVMNLDDIIIPMRTNGELKINLEEDSVDFVLFYDIIRSLLRIDGTLNPYRRLLDEFDRILKHGGKLSVFIKHLHTQSISPHDVLEITESVFDHHQSTELELMHWDNLETGTIHNFRRI